MKVCQGRPIFLVVVIADFALESSQSVGWVARGARAKGRVKILRFLDPAELRREAMTVGDVLILSVDAQIAVAIGGSCWIKAVGKLPRVEPVGADHRGMLAFTPYALKRQAPVRCRAIQDGVTRFIRPGAKDRERFVRRAISRNLRVEGLVP